VIGRYGGTETRSHPVEQAVRFIEPDIGQEQQKVFAPDPTELYQAA
jgi:hypothetical protein